MCYKRAMDKVDLYILAFHVVLVVFCLGGIVLAGFHVIDVAYGFFLGVALYSLHWRWRYGHWPD